MYSNNPPKTEEDIKHLYITPALERGWPAAHIRMEAKITDGRFNLRGNLVAREQPKRADYLLCPGGRAPIAVVEAKDESHGVSFGLQQAKTYATMMDLRFAYSSNGHGFTEYDFFTGVERNLAMDEFPSEAELVARFQGEGNFSPAELAVRETPAYTSADTNTPRYYQQVAIDRTLAAVARGQRRLLLVMATGTGKTFTAFQIVWRLRQAGLAKKILYLADRNILVDQSIAQDFAPLANVIHKVNFAKDDRTKLTSYDVFFSLYQQMVGDAGEEHFRDLFDPAFFDLVIVDECHRGSAKEDSRWRRVLDYFASAVHLGMTATPKETKEVSNIDYFGAPVYTYSLKQGIEDGFLAPFRVVNVHLNISDGWRPTKGQRDFFGDVIPDRIYDNTDYDYTIVIEDRIRAVAHEITEFLKRSGDRLQKTIVFCADEDAAERMRQALVKENADIMAEHPDYIVRITGSDAYGKSKLDYFISVAQPYPTIATTSDLLSTGVDAKTTKVIALDKHIVSMTQFKQIVGRGTRVREDVGKTHFTILDFRGVTRLFADPDWDGPPLQDPDFTPSGDPVIDGANPLPPDDGTDGGSDNGGTSGGDAVHEPAPKPYVDANGCRVRITHESVAIYDTDGKLLRQENIIDYTRENVRGDYGDLAAFIRTWTASAKKRVIADALKKHGIDLDALKSDMKMADVDDFDFLCHVAYDQKPLTRRERAEGVKKRDFLHRYSGDARAVLDLLLDRYQNYGIEEIESTTVFKLKDFERFGALPKIVKSFGGKQAFRDALNSLEDELYKIG
ncbi:EcoAI/FtnUII family type I restriction enzme subunit R [uncultured Selenomonas sp.]|uniref:EcoAI/FtnUII family type I restriction enzme subunit R n=1 Tax=uncultured Selenomonas sp. TaxID=159275 RepID=UPI0025F848F7|nr:DEAD/DEAH box helicase family protein [uncultured Selenomonas sp.]